MKRLILSILLLLPLLASAATVRVRDLPVVTDLYNTNLVMVVTGTTNALASPQTVVSAAGAVTNGQSDVTLSAPTFLDAITLELGRIVQTNGMFVFDLPITADGSGLTNLQTMVIGPNSYMQGIAGNGEYPVVIGYNATNVWNEDDSGGVAIGQSAFSQGEGIAVGLNAIAIGESIALRGEALVDKAIAIGQSSVASENTTIAIGFSAMATAASAIAIGKQASNGTPNSVLFSGQITAPNFVASAANTTTPSFKSSGTNNMILLAPDGGSWILKVDNEGNLTTVTNSTGL